MLKKEVVDRAANRRKEKAVKNLLAAVVCGASKRKRSSNVLGSMPEMQRAGDGHIGFARTPYYPAKQMPDMP